MESSITIIIKITTTNNIITMKTQMHFITHFFLKKKI